MFSQTASVNSPAVAYPAASLRDKVDALKRTIDKDRRRFLPNLLRLTCRELKSGYDSAK